MCCISHVLLHGPFSRLIALWGLVDLKCVRRLCACPLHVSHLLYKTQVSRISASDSQTEDWCEKCFNLNSIVFELHNSVFLRIAVLSWI